MANFAREAILQAFLELLGEKNIDKITVKDIVERCGITRGGFYYHFQDIYAVFESLLQRETGKLPLGGLSAADWEKHFLHAAAFLYEKRRAVYNIYYSSHRDELMLHIDRAIRQVMSQAVEAAAAGLSVSQSDKELITALFSCALRGLFSEWAEAGMRPPLEDMLRRSCYLLHGTMQDTLRRGAAQPAALAQN